MTGYAVQYLPGLRDAVEQGDEATAARYRDVLLDALREATRLAERGAGAAGMSEGGPGRIGPARALRRRYGPCTLRRSRFPGRVRCHVLRHG